MCYLLQTTLILSVQSTEDNIKSQCATEDNGVLTTDDNIRILSVLSTEDNIMILSVLSIEEITLSLLCCNRRTYLWNVCENISRIIGPILFLLILLLREEVFRVAFSLLRCRIVLESSPFYFPLGLLILSCVVNSKQALKYHTLNTDLGQEKNHNTCHWSLSKNK